jgi:hypothetical protein
MFRNFLLAIFLFALALPALAVPVASAEASQAIASDCHGMPMDRQDDDAQEHGKSVRLHGCIGCIAPVSPSFEVFQSASLPSITQSAPLNELLGTIARPTIPPPRS